VILFGLTPFIARAETLTILSCDLKTCIEYAQEHHPSLQAAEAGWSSAKSSIDTKHGEFWPSLELGIDTGPVYGEPTGAFFLARGVPSEEVDFQQYYKLEVTLSYPLFKEGVFLGRSAPSILEAEGRSEEAEHNLQITKEQIVYEVSESYFTVLKNQEELRAIEEILKARQLDYEIALKKFEQELISRNDLLLAEVGLFSSKSELQMAQSALSVSLANLAMRMGLDPKTKIEINDSPQILDPLPSLEELLNFSYQKRPEIAMQQAMLKSLRAGHQLVRTEWFPTLDLVSIYSIGDDYSPPTSSSWQSGLQLKMIIGGSTINRAKSREMEAKITEQEHELLQLKHTIGLEVIQVYHQISDAESRISISEKHVEQGEEAVKLVRLKFETNLVPQSEVFEIQGQLWEATKALAQARFDIRLGYANLRKIIGGEWRRN
jgi:outer membrane protein TolC